MTAEEPEKDEGGQPFAACGEPLKPDGGEKKNGRKKKTEPKAAKKIAYSAAASAIAVVVSVITVFLPIRIMPLVIASFCFFLAYVKCGALYGTLCAAVTTLVTFLCGGVSSSLILLAVCFFPYSLLAVLLRRFDYRKVKGALIRVACVIALALAAMTAVYFIARAVLLGGMDIVAAVGKVGFALAAVIVAVAAVITDFLFVQCDALITPKLK